MPRSKPSERILAKDGRVARDNGEWGKDKLQFLEEFGPLALKATSAKHTRIYLDLFAGPGINVTRDRSTEEYLGSPLRALSLEAPGSGARFTDAYFVNLDIDDNEALAARVAEAVAGGSSLLPAGSIHCLHGDSNVLVTQILDRVHPKGYLFVFADPENPGQLPWATVESLRRYRNHESVDLYMLFPYGMALSRMAGYNTEATEMNASALTTFFGDESWRACLPLRSSPERRHDFFRCVEDAYLARLRSLWSHADVICQVKRRNQNLYNMLFASDKPAGKKIAQWAKRRVADTKEQIPLL